MFEGLEPLRPLYNTCLRACGVQICDPEDNPRTDYIAMRRGAFKIDQRKVNAFIPFILKGFCTT
jgi:hypothetical protein